MSDPHRTKVNATDKHNRTLTEFAHQVTPAFDHIAITPSDTTILDGVRAIVWQTDGACSVETDNGTIITYTRLAGEYIPVMAKRVRVSGTTATVVGWK